MDTCTEEDSKYTLICRSCLSTNTNDKTMISLSTQSEDQLNLTYLECFYYCTNLSNWICDDSGGGGDGGDGDGDESTELCMPDTICEDCLNELRLAFNFRTKCEKSDYELRTKLKKSIEYVNEEFIVEKSVEYLEDVDQNHEEQQINQSLIDGDDNVDDCVEMDQQFDQNDGQNYEQQQDEEQHQQQQTNEPLNDDDDGDVDDNFDSGGMDDQFSQSDEENREEIQQKSKEESEEIEVDIENSQIDFHIEDGARQYEEIAEKPEENQKHQEQIIPKNENINQGVVIFIIDQSPKPINGVPSDLVDKSLTLPNDNLNVTTTNLEALKLKAGRFECDSCERRFKRKSTLEKHMLLHSDKNQAPDENLQKINDETTNKGQFKCEICNKNYNNQKYFAKHQLIHMGMKPEKNHLCSECGKGFSTPQRLKIHSFTHTGEKNFSCDQCDKSFSTQYRLHSHQRIHTGERPYHCTICSMTFSQANALKCHKRVHTGEKPYRCKYCDKSFSQNTILKTHMTLHTGKTVKCPDCDKKFSRASYLILHRREHTGEKPYACDRCPNRYKQKGHLDRHLDTHLGIKHKCEICGNQYSKQWSLKMHMFSHSGTKPFNCLDCDVSFLRRDKYKNHMKLIHGVSIENNKDFLQTELN